MTEFDQEISEAVSNYIDQIETLLPTVIEKLKLDDTSIKFSETKYQNLMKRTKVARRHKNEKLEYKRAFFSMMKNIQGRILTDNIENTFFTDESVLGQYNNSTNPGNNIILKNISEENGHKLSNHSVIQELPLHLNYQTDFSPQFGTPGISDEIIPFESYPSLFSKQETIKSKICTELRKQMNKDKILNHVIGNIEQNLDQFIEENNLQISYNIDERYDIEIPNWKKIIINFNFDENDFELKMQIWDDLDDFIRMKIDEVKNSHYRHGSNSKFVNEINESIYTDVKI